MKKIFSIFSIAIKLIKRIIYKIAPKRLKKSFDEINEMGGFFSWTWKQYFLRRFEKKAHIAYNDKTYRKTHDDWSKSVDELLSTLKGTSANQRHIRSKKSKKQMRTAKGRQAHIDDMMKRWGR
tara:strand:+ start:271 stop:639 length:369 start_codon:yes stop_codon:yes gene_type:complete